jgi:hypothetical protein
MVKTQSFAFTFGFLLTISMHGAERMNQTSRMHTYIVGSKVEIRETVGGLTRVLTHAFLA